MDSEQVIIENRTTSKTGHLESDLQLHPDPQKPGRIPHEVTFSTLSQEGNWAEVKCQATELMESSDLLEAEGLDDFSILLARLFGLRPWYTRFETETRLSFHVDGEVYEGTGFSILEFMEFE